MYAFFIYVVQVACSYTTKQYFIWHLTNILKRMLFISFYFYFQYIFSYIIKYPLKNMTLKCLLNIIFKVYNHNLIPYY